MLANVNQFGSKYMKVREMGDYGSMLPEFISTRRGSGWYVHCTMQ